MLKRGNENTYESRIPGPGAETTRSRLRVWLIDPAVERDLLT